MMKGRRHSVFFHHIYIIYRSAPKANNSKSKPATPIRKKYALSNQEQQKANQARQVETSNMLDVSLIERELTLDPELSETDLEKTVNVEKNPGAAEYTDYTDYQEQQEDTPLRDICHKPLSIETQSIYRLRREI